MCRVAHFYVGTPTRKLEGGTSLAETLIWRVLPPRRAVCDRPGRKRVSSVCVAVHCMAGEFRGCCCVLKPAV